MTQINLQTGTCREIRPPYKMGRPSKPVVPQGETVMVRVPMDAPKDAIFQIEHPSGSGTARGNCDGASTYGCTQ